MGKYMELRIKKTFTVCLGFTVLASVWLIYSKTWLDVFFSGVTVLLGAALSCITWHMSKLNPADSHTWRTLSFQYLIFVLLSCNGQRVHAQFVRKCKDVRKTQAEVLMKILRANHETMYGINYRFSEMTSPDDFLARHPLTRYSQYLPHIHDIVQGKHNILTKDKVLYLATSSGTTGSSKIIPVTQLMKGATARYVASLMYYMMKMNGRLDLGRVFVLSYKSVVTTVTCGLRKGPITAHMFRYMPFVVSPEEAFEIPNEQASIHVHAVFALQEAEISHMEALMSTLVYSFWRYIEHNWEAICANIERASLPKDIHADRDILVSLEANLSPNKSRADFLREEFAKGFKGIARRIWPNIRFVKMLATGGFAHYGKVLALHYMKGIKQLSLVHVASEGFIGFNISLNSDDFNYTAMIEYAFQEYIPLESVDEKQPVTAKADEVKLNRLYEVVLTTPMGLYRYRTGDVVKIVSFCYQCPVYEFQYRLGQLLNLNWEKLPESAFYDSVQQTVDELKQIILVDYTVTEDIHLDGLRDHDETPHADVKHYVLFIEVEGQNEDFILADENKNKFDDRLRHNFELYDTMRSNGSIGLMEVIQMNRGTFHRLKEKITEHIQNQQYKLPRVLRDKLHLKYLLSQDLRKAQPREKTEAQSFA